MRLLLTVFLFYISHAFYAQSDKTHKGSELHNIELGLFSGFNSTKLYAKGYEPKAGMRHFYGLQIDRNFSEKFSIGFSVARFNRASYISNLELRKSGIEFNVFPKYKVGDFSIFGGLQFVNGVTKLEHQIPYFDLQSVGNEESLQFNPIVGVDVKMAYRLNLFINKAIKAKRENESNWQIGLRYNVSKKRENPSYRRIKRLHAIEDIDALKNGNVLIRLKTAQPKIDALRKAGREEKAGKVEKKQLEENREIVNAFRKEFTFTNYYFFYSHHSKAVKNNELKYIFLDDNLILDSSILVDESKASYIIELTNIEPDTNQVFSHYNNRTTGSFEQERVPAYHGSPNHTFLAFVVKNQNFEQLLRPFPYYSRFILPSLKKHPEQLLFIGPLVVPLLSATTYETSVRNLNKKLHRFHAARESKIQRWYKRPFEFYEPHLPEGFNPPF